MKLELFTKNFALTCELEIESSHVPRVGETVTLNQEVGYLQGTTELLVHEVTYILQADKLTPLVRCHASNGPANRRVVLEENGWL